MALTRRKPRKKLTRRSRSGKGKGNPDASLTPEARLHLVAWEAYEKPAFFKRLVKNRSSRSRLKKVTAKYLLGDKELGALQARLRAKKVQVNFTQLMGALHSYTSPKKGSRQDVLRKLGRRLRPWSVWDPATESKSISRRRKTRR